MNAPALPGSASLPSTLPRSARDDRGTVTAFTVVFVLAALAFAGLVLDAGLAVSAKVAAISTAQSAARAGAQELDLSALRAQGVIRLDPAAAEATARDWVARSGATGTVVVTGDTVTVTVHAARRTQLLHLVGIDAIGVGATVTATAVQS